MMIKNVTGAAICFALLLLVNSGAAVAMQQAEKILSELINNIDEHRTRVEDQKNQRDQDRRTLVPPLVYKTVFDHTYGEEVWIPTRLVPDVYAIKTYFQLDPDDVPSIEQLVHELQLLQRLKPPKIWRGAKQKQDEDYESLDENAKVLFLLQKAQRQPLDIGNGLDIFDIAEQIVPGSELDKEEIKNKIGILRKITFSVCDRYRLLNREINELLVAGYIDKIGAVCDFDRATQEDNRIELMRATLNWNLTKQLKQHQLDDLSADLIRLIKQVAMKAFVKEMKDLVIKLLAEKTYDSSGKFNAKRDELIKNELIEIDRKLLMTYTVSSMLIKKSLDPIMIGGVLDIMDDIDQDSAGYWR
ncbi:MAG: hypothetical protein AAF310_02770 [Myxococcota bacterium]